MGLITHIGVKLCTEDCTTLRTYCTTQNKILLTALTRSVAFIFRQAF
jgi:hypothetical protein